MIISMIDVTLHSTNKVRINCLINLMLKIMINILINSMSNSMIDIINNIMIIYYD